MLAIGETTEVKGSAAKPYVIKNVDGSTWTCSCPAWRNCPGAVNRKTCKHIRQVNGAAAEAARVSDFSSISQVGTNSGRTSSTIPNTSVSPTASPDRVQEIIGRAEAEGRKLRQDEKAKLNGPPVLLAQQDSTLWMNVEDLCGWWMSEKLDGVRAYWNGSQFITRQGNVYKAPDWFTKDLPNHPLDGELHMGRQLFQATLSIVRRDNAGEEWKKITYVVFDMPHLLDIPFERRMEMLDEVVSQISSPYVRVHTQRAVTSHQDVETELARMLKLGAEGLMLRQPDSLYEIGRSSTLLKVKQFHDAEAVVIAHNPGKGKHKGKLGGLECRLPNGKEFNVGSGLTDAERRNPPPVGSTVTYRYTELTNDGIPKCASFVCVRDYE